NRALVARSLRLLLVASFVAVVFPLVVHVLGSLIRPQGAALLLPFLAAALAVAALPPVLVGADRLLAPIAAGDEVTIDYNCPLWFEPQE
ncbi:MAG: hypothetical protein ABR562_10215, partial [Thermoplasmatota archaeon]